MAPEWRLLVEKVKRLAVPAGREALGEFALEGHRSIERALRNGAPLTEVLVSERFYHSEIQREREILTEVQQKEIPLRVAPDEAVAELTGRRRIGEVFGVMAIPESPSLESLFDGEEKRLVMVGWNLADPGNTGAIIRSALAAGASGFLAVGTTDPWHPKAVRTSMGSLFKLPILRVPAESLWLEDLHSLEAETFATVCSHAEALPEVRLTNARSALLLGSEAFGLPDEIADRCDRRITIPMPEGVDSLSVNAAAAVLAYTLLH
jgi:TrmH family RNA methyltransferase